MKTDGHFPADGMPGRLLRGTDGKFYFRPNAIADAWDLEEEQNCRLFDCGDFENAVEVTLNTYEE